MVDYDNAKNLHYQRWGPEFKLQKKRADGFLPSALKSHRVTDWRQSSAGHQGGLCIVLSTG